MRYINYCEANDTQRSAIDRAYNHCSYDWREVRDFPFGKNGKLLGSTPPKKNKDMELMYERADFFDEPAVGLTFSYL